MVELRHYIVNTLARFWVYLGNRMRRRPFQMVGIIIGLALLTGLLFYSLSKVADNSNDIAEIQRSFCSGRAEFVEVEENCRRLFDQLLKAATPEQVEALNELLEGAP